jgi:hypothetical protein
MFEKEKERNSEEEEKKESSLSLSSSVAGLEGILFPSLSLSLYFSCIK